MQKHICNIYIFLWCLYSLQGTLYSRGSIISQLLLVIIIMISFYYFFILLTHHKLPDVLKVLSWLLLLWTIYGFIIIIYGNGVKALPNHYYLKNIYVAQLPVYVFYYFSKEGYLTESLLRKWAVVFLIIGIARFNTHYDENLANAIERGSSKEEFTNNKAYVILAIMPFIPLYFKKPIIQYILLGVCMLYVLLGMKRGAILSGAICSVWFLFKSFKENSYSGTKVWKGLLTIIIIAGAVFAIQWMLLTSAYFVQRLDLTLEGNSSGRDRIYLNYFNYFVNQSNYFHLLLGNGADATFRILHQYAHDDWLEIAINNGLFMVFLYAIYWIIMLRTIGKVKKVNYTYFLILGMYFIIYFMKTIYSMSYYSIPFVASCAFGFALANSINTE